MNDAIDQAIASAAATKQQDMVPVGPVQLGVSGRTVMLMVPSDLTDAELLDLLQWLASPRSGLRSYLEAARRGPQLFVPAGPT